MGYLDKGLRLLREGYATWLTHGGRYFGVFYAAAAAEVLRDAGCRDGATDFLLAGEKSMRESEERFGAAVLFSVRGRSMELDGDCPSAEAAYRQALEIAEQQGALLYSLRAATGLARLYRLQDRTNEAFALLGPIYDRFTEGVDWPDLIRARAALDGIRDSSAMLAAKEMRP
jgi:ATP/maltotriose-dependent transcriptional regulator MalT